ncbi:MAG: PAS domain S-box protein, partial [Candidatus Korobacteraceae bacterium]
MKKSLYVQPSPAQLAGAYLLTALAWLFASDRILGVSGISAAQVVRFAVVNGFCFIGLTAWLFYRLLGKVHTRAEEVVRKQETYADELFEAAPEAACLVGPDTRVLRVNEQFTRMFGYDNQEAAGQHLADLTVPAGMTVDKRLDEEMPRVRKDGTRLYVSMVTTPVKVNGQAALRVIYRDLAERKRAEQESKAAAERLKAILENAPIGIVVTDFKGRLLESNAAAHRLLGYTAGELGAMSFVQYTHPDDIQRNLELFQQLQDGKVQSYELEKRFIRKDGKVIWGRAVASRLGGELSISMIEDITARKEMEQQLQATAQRLTAILNRAPIGIDLSDDEGRFLETNPAFERITGYSAGELKGMTFYDLTHPGERARNQEYMAELKAGKVQSYEMEKRYLRKDGKTIWVRVVGSRVDAGHTMGIVEDITERKEAAAQLQASAERLHAILERAPVGIAITDRKGRLVEFNAALLRMCGYSAEELKGTSFTRYTHPDDIAENLQLFNQAANGALPSVEIQKRFMRKDGQVIWVRVISSGLNKDFMIGIVEDVTARKQAEQQLRETAERLQAILENAPVGISIADPRDGRILESNAAYQRIVGYSAEELKGMTFKNYTHPDDLPHNLALLDAINTGKSQHYELEKRYLRKDGKTVWVRARRSRLNGEHSIGIVEDITERKRVVEELRRSEARFRGLIESSIVGILVRSADGRVTYANDAFLAITGYTREDVAAGMHWRDLSPPEYQARIDQNVEDIRRTGKYRPYEKEYLRKDGSRVPVMTGGALTEAGDVVVFVVDLTERKKQQLELERLARIVESADDAIFSLSLDGLVLSWNEGAERLLGYSKA